VIASVLERAKELDGRDFSRLSLIVRERLRSGIEAVAIRNANGSAARAVVDMARRDG